MLNLLTAEVKKLLKPIAQQKTLIITLGNELRADDGVGPYLAGQLKSNDLFTIVDAGEKPESIISEVAELKPAKTIIIDAANFGGKIGEARILPQELIPDTTLSTHMFPIKIIAKIITEDTKTPVYFLGIQLKSAQLGQTMCAEVKDTAEKIINFLKKG